MTNTDLDASLKLVSDERRRRVIRRLRHETDGGTTVDDLVDRLHSSESPSATGRRIDRDQLLLRLVHNHLPKLDDHGVVEYDPDRGTVRYRADERVEAVLDSLPDNRAQVDL